MKRYILFGPLRYGIGILLLLAVIALTQQGAVFGEDASPLLTPTHTPTTPTAPDLTASEKLADRETVDYFGGVGYTIILHNTGAPATVSITDTIPFELSYVPGSATGGATYDEDLDAILWTGAISTGQTVVITFDTEGPFPIIPHDTPIVNEVIIDDGVHPPFTRSVTVIGNPGATPTPTHTHTPSPTWTPTPTATPTHTPSPTWTPTPMATPTHTPSPTWTPTPTATPTSTPSPTWTPTPTATATPQPEHRVLFMPIFLTR